MYRSKLLDRAKADRTADLVWRPADRRRVNGVWHKALTAASLYGSPLCQEKSCFWCWVASPSALHSQPTDSPKQPLDRGQDLSSDVYGDCSIWTSCCDDARWPGLVECEHLWPSTHPKMKSRPQQKMAAGLVSAKNDAPST